MERRSFFKTLAAASMVLGSGTVRNNTVSANDAPASGNAPCGKPLAFHDGRFKILQFTDLHLGFTADAEEMKRAEQTLDLIRTMLKKESPDIAVITGDMITAEPEGLSGGLAEGWRKLTAPFEEAQIPFVSAFGNHDHERKESAAEQLAMIQESPMCLTYSDDPSITGAGNCFLPILGSDQKEAYRLWMFDSLSYPQKEGLSGYDWIKFDQIQWYRAASQTAADTAGKPVPGLAFFHIPLCEYWQIHKAEGTFGTCNEAPCPGILNSGLFAAFIEQKDIRGVFTGHDHVNDYIAMYQGIALAYGRKTGFGSYGDLGRGGRVIELTEDGQFTTYVTTPETHELDWTLPVK